jgi:hypothetical protein
MSTASEHGQLADSSREHHLVTIYVNTVPYQVEKGKISFEEVVKLAYPTPPSGQNVGFTVLYQRGEGNSEGSLVAGQSVEVRDGMIFDVTPTDLS